MENITIFEDANFTIPAHVEICDLTPINWTGGENSKTVIGSGADAQTFESYYGQPLFGPTFAALPKSKPLVEYRAAAGDVPEYDPDVHGKTYYLKPNMRLIVDMYKITSGGITRLHYGIRGYIGTTPLNGGYIGTDETPPQTRAIRLGLIRRLGVTSIMAFVETGSTSAQSYWISQNFWDGSATIHTKSKSKNATPSGYGGARGISNDNRIPQSMYTSIDIIQRTNSAHGIHVYQLQGGQLDMLYGKLWGNAIDKIQNMVYKPTAGMLSLHLLPFEPAVSATGDQMINICGHAYYVGSNTYNIAAQMQLIGDWERSLNANELFTQSFLDYAPYVSAQLELPFCGIVPIDINRIMDGGIRVRYIADIITGNCMAEVYVRDHALEGSGEYTLYSRYSGNCAYHMPLTADESGGRQMLGIFSGLGTIGVGAATANPAMMAAGAAGMAHGVLAPHDVGMVGTFSQNVACLAGDQFIRLHLTLHDDLTIIGDDDKDMLQDISGLPAGCYGTVEEFEPFVAGEIHLDGIEATASELEALASMFAGGVYL